MRKSILDSYHTYVAMGSNRSLAKLSKQSKIPLSTLERWSAQYDWQHKLADIEKEVEEGTRAELVEDLIESKKKYRDMIRRAIEQATPEIDTVRDFDRLVKLDLLLAGDVTAREEIKNMPSMIEIIEKLRAAKAAERVG